MIGYILCDKIYGNVPPPPQEVGALPPFDSHACNYNTLPFSDGLCTQISIPALDVVDASSSFNWLNLSKGGTRGDALGEALDIAFEFLSSELLLPLPTFCTNGSVLALLAMTSPSLSSELVAAVSIAVVASPIDAYVDSKGL